MARSEGPFRGAGLGAAEAGGDLGGPGGGAEVVGFCEKERENTLLSAVTGSGFRIINKDFT